MKLDPEKEKPTFVACGLILTFPLEKVPALKRTVSELGGTVRYFKLSAGRLSIVEMGQERAHSVHR
jgi:hypothetical protein